jgi:hypothetical protein
VHTNITRYPVAEQRPIRRPAESKPGQMIAACKDAPSRLHVTISLLYPCSQEYKMMNIVSGTREGQEILLPGARGATTISSYVQETGDSYHCHCGKLRMERFHGLKLPTPPPPFSYRYEGQRTRLRTAVTSDMMATGLVLSIGRLTHWESLTQCVPLTMCTTSNVYHSQCVPLPMCTT